MNDSKSFYFNPFGKGIEVFLGPTEARLMELCWTHGNLTVKKALFHLGEKSAPAYTTVMTVLGNLSEKGLLKIEKQGRPYSYSPVSERKQFIRERVLIIEKCLKANFGKV